MIKTNKNFLKTLVTSALLISSVVVSNHVESKVVEAATTTIKFGTNDVQISSANVSFDDSFGNSWTVDTVGTTSFTKKDSYYQVGSSSKPASSITFTMTAQNDMEISSFTMKFGGFSGTAGTVNLTDASKTPYATVALNAATDVTLSYTGEPVKLSASDNLLVTVSNISKGVKVYSINYDARSLVSYTATLHLYDDVTDEIQSNAETGLLTQPSNLERTGYTFIGWYTDSSYTNDFDFSTPLTENIDLYAKWLKEEDAYLDSTKASLGFSYSCTSSTKIVTSIEEISDNKQYSLAGSFLESDVAKLAVVSFDSAKTFLPVANSVDEVSIGEYQFPNESRFKISKLDSQYYTISTYDNLYIGCSTAKSLTYSETIDDSHKWKISFDAEGTLTIQNSIAPLRYNYSSPRITTYASEQNDIKLIEVSSYSFSNYAMRFGTTISAENYAKLGTVETYGVLMLPTAKLSTDTRYSTFKEVYESLKDGDTFEKIFSTFNVLNVTNASAEGKIEMQGDAENGYSFGAVLRNVPVASLGTSISAVCYVINDAGDVYFAEQRDISISDMVDVYASGSVELDSNVLQVCKELQNYIASLSL